MNASDRTKRIVDKILGALGDDMPEAHPLDYLKEFVLAAQAVFYAFAKGFGIPAPTIQVLLQAVVKDTVLILLDENREKTTEKDFIDAYIALAKGFGFYVGACGCCDSPFLNEVEGDRETTLLANDAGEDVTATCNDLAGHEAHLRGLGCTPCGNSGCYIKARYRFPDGKLLCAECGKELEG